MTSRIKILDETTAGRIAAGEVVERPVSVVKELVENSLDAGADQVIIEIEEGGTKGITVSDNGCGMSREELQLAFCRHATSKITSAEDLYSLSTLGFRGEALPSIAAVSRLVMKTRLASEPAGHKIELAGGKILSIETTGCPAGTTVAVADLFYNTPARRKHLKSKGTEASLVADMVQNIALARPSVRFVLRHNKKVIFSVPGSGKLLDVVTSVYGVEAARQMLELKTIERDIVVKGFVSRPALNRKTRSHVTFLLNGRYIRNTVLSQAVKEAYQGLITPGRFPIAVIAIELKPSMVDINVHPSKLEVKIDDEYEIAQLVRQVIREKLQSSQLVPSYNSSNPSPNFIPGNRHYGISEPVIKQTVQESMQMQPIYEEQEDTPPVVCEATASEAKHTERPVQEHVLAGEKGAFPFLQVIGQLLPTYILTSGPDGLYILDQHAVHERILYEKLLAVVKCEKPQTQYLLTPLPLELNYPQAQTLQKAWPDFKQLGFEIEEFGSGTYLVRGVPAGIATERAMQNFIDLLEELALAGSQANENLQSEIAARLACRAAIKSGETLSMVMMEKILHQLAGAKEPYTCPHGRPTIVKITEKELEQMFKRIN